MVTHDHAYVDLLQHPVQHGDAAVAVSVDHVAQDDQIVGVGQPGFLQQPQEIRQQVAEDVGGDVDHRGSPFINRR